MTMGVFVNVIAIMMGIAGIGLFGHAWYRSVASGQEIYSNVLQSGSGPIKSFDIDLEPTMSPISFDFSAGVDQSYVRRSGSNQSINYWASLTLERKMVLQRSVTFKVDPEESSDGKKRTLQILARAGLGHFDVPAAGRYRFAMAVQAGDPRAIRNIEVEVRRNVEGPNMKKVWWGLGLFFAGGLLQWLFGAPLPSSRND